MTTLVYTLGQVAVFIALMLVVGRRLFPTFALAGGRHRLAELFYFVRHRSSGRYRLRFRRAIRRSFALGAFFAGMVMRESRLSYRAAEESLPLRDAFSVLFFVSVGMLFDPRVD